MNAATRLSALRDAAAVLHVTGSRGVLLGALLAAILLPQWLGGNVLQFTFRYDRAAIAAGEWWRLASGHFVHLDAWHALANATGALLIWALVGRAWQARGWLLVMLGCTLATSAGLWWGAPAVGWYVGASGLLHGLLAAGALALALRGDPLARIVLAVLAVKLGWEWLQGPLSEAPGAVAGAQVITAAHRFGALGGLCCALVAAPFSPRGEPRLDA